VLLALLNVGWPWTSSSLRACDGTITASVAYVPPPAGPDSAPARWISQSMLEYSHAFQILIYYSYAYSYAPSVPDWEPFAVNPDPGKGC
jgi:hypothetical protein